MIPMYGGKINVARGYVERNMVHLLLMSLIQVINGRLIISNQNLKAGPKLFPTLDLYNGLIMILDKMVVYRKK